MSEATGAGRSGADRTALVEALVPPLVALVVALIVGDVLILAFGQSPRAVYTLLLEGTWGNPYGLGQVLYKATTLTLTGLAISVGLRAGLFNIGAESQLTAGAFAAAIVGLVLPASLHWGVAAPLCLVAAALAGGAVGAVPGALKARFGTHEVIVTIMLNFIVLAIFNFVVAKHLHDPETLHTPAVHTGKLPRLSTTFASLHGSAASWVVLVALLTSALVAFVVGRTRFGLELRAVGLSPDAAEAAGIRVGATWTKAMALSGAIAGLAGTNFVLGYKGYFEDGLAGGAGFVGIAVALLGKTHPAGVILAALLFATLSQGGLAIHAAVPKQLVEVIQATVILTMAAASPEVRRVLADARARLERTKKEDGA